MAARNAPMEMKPAEFREAGHKLVDEIAEFLENLPRRPVSRDEPPGRIRDLLPPGGPPARGQDASELLSDTARKLFDHSVFNGHPRFFGYITSSAAPIGALADMLAATVNPNMGGWQLSPLASEIEGQTCRWIASMLDYPEDGSGLLVSGGNMANLVAFFAARRAKGSEAIRKSGVDPRNGRMISYVSADTHTWIQKAADLSGLGTDSIRWIDVDDESRMNVDALRRAIAADREAGDRPFLVVGTGGTVGTGAVDPLPAIAEVAREQDLWFHVDGAYGAFAVLSEDCPDDLRGLSLADSLAIDPHKWLYAPLEAGCVLVRDREALRDAFSYTPSYYRFTGEEEEPRTNYYELGMQNSRGFRALKVWLALRQVGVEGYRRMIGDDIRLAAELHRNVERTDELEAGGCELSICTFRYVPPDLQDDSPATREYLNRLNEELLARMKRDGRAFVSNAVVRDRFLLRACIVNFRTDSADVAALPEIVVGLGRQTHRDLGGPEIG